MAQLLRPDSDVANSWTGGFAAIDEATASDADFAYSANNPNGSGAEFGLGDPGTTPGSGTCTVRYRYAKVNSGALDNGGSAVDLAVELREGATVLASTSHTGIAGSWTAGSFTLAASAVTDWTDLRIFFAASGGGGNPNSRRGAAVSWAEVEAPDGALTHHTLTADPVGFTLSGTDAGLFWDRLVAGEGGLFTLAGADATLTYTSIVTAEPGAFVLTGTDATLTYTSLGTQYTLEAEPGTFSMYCSLAELWRGRRRQNKRHHKLRIRP